MSESPVPLPEQPSLEQLRNQAKDLRRTSGIPLWEAQLSVARRYGFTSWARLKRHVELLTRYSRFPERAATENEIGVATGWWVALVAGLLILVGSVWRSQDSGARRKPPGVL